MLLTTMPQNEYCVTLSIQAHSTKVTVKYEQ